MFPDPISGQVTVHPGIEGGWQTDRWLRHLLDGADNPEARAFSYGIVAHAAADIFAHTYVNAFAGDIFLLTNGEREVELRHFLLEKYIESLTPPVFVAGGLPFSPDRDLQTATSFLRDRLLIDGDAAGQFLRAPFAQHLGSMHAVRRGVQNLDDGTQAVIGQITSWAAQYYKLQYDLVISAQGARAAVAAAEVTLSAARQTVEFRRAFLSTQLTILEGANKFVQDNPGLINGQAQLLLEQTQRAADLAATATSVAANAASEIAGWEQRMNSLADELGKLICNIIGGVLPKCNELRNAISDLNDRISGAQNAERLARDAANAAAALRDGTRATLNVLRQQLDEATRGLAEGIYQANIIAAQAELTASLFALEQAQRGLDETKTFLARVQAELDIADRIIDQIKEAADQYNLVTLTIRNWRQGIDVAAEEFIKTSHDVGLIMLRGNGDILAEYARWMSCYGPVFTGVPYQGAQVGCFVRDEITQIMGEIDRIVDGLPPLLRWVVAPSRELQREGLRRLQPEIDKAKASLLTLLTDRRTAEFLLLLMHPADASRQRLIDAYRTVESGRPLLRFDDVASLVDQDLGISNGQLNPRTFAPLAHSVTLAKLALLDPAGLNQLIRDLAGDFVSPRYGSPIYPAYPGNFSILLDVVRSIDGNHQWQAFGLPYPRSVGSTPTSPAQIRRNHYGHNHADDARLGLRIWVDPYLRDRVFSRLFPAPVMGVLRNRPELQPRRYAFAECAANPFPATQDPSTGQVRIRDPRCDDEASAHLPAALPFADATDYRGRYHQCDTPLIGERNWTLAASMRSQNGANTVRDRIIANFPDMSPEVWQPRGRNRFWTVMLASCTTAERAAEVRALALRRGIAADIYVWRQRTPWQRSAERP